jgi:hypothetical protein
MKTRTLWDSQSAAISFILAEMPFEQAIGVYGPTGWGKSTIARIALEILVRMPEFKHAILAVPQLQIEAAFAQSAEHWLFPKAEFDHTATPQLSIHLDKITALRDDALCGKEGLTTRLQNPSRLDSPITLTTHQALVTWGIEVLPADLTGYLIALDEAHRLERRSKLAAFKREWKKRGGKILYLTATPFRSSGKLDIPDDIPCFHLTLAEHTFTGKYAPRNIRLAFQRSTTMNATDLRQLRGADLTATGLVKLKAMCGELVQVWRDKSSRKTVIIIPAGRSRRFAKALCKELALEIGDASRVFNAVGNDKDPEAALSTKAALTKLLNAERLAERYEDSTVDVIVACARFNLGTDWPFCAHVINVGLPRSMNRILQRLGRALRNKLFIKGYPDPQEALMTFVVPTATVALWEAFDRQAKDHAFIVAALMADTDTGMAYIATLRSRLADAGRKRRNDPQKALVNADRLASMIGLDVECTRDAYAKCQQAALVLRDQGIARKDITWPLISKHLRTRLKLKPAEVNRCKRAHDLRHKVLGDKELEKLLNAWGAAESRKRNAGKTNTRIIRKELQALFDEAVDDFDGLLDASNGVTDIVARFTGQSSREVATALSERLGIPALSLEELTSGCEKWVKANGTGSLPDREEDASAYFDQPAGTLTWQQVDNQFHRFSMDEVAV